MKLHLASRAEPLHEGEVTANVEDWERELREAGWKPYKIRGHERRTMWVAPSGNIYRGPYHAWRVMQSHKQWGGEA